MREIEDNFSIRSDFFDVLLLLILLDEDDRKVGFVLFFVGGSVKLVKWVFRIDFLLIV